MMEIRAMLIAGAIFVVLAGSFFAFEFSFLTLNGAAVPKGWQNNATFYIKQVNGTITSQYQQTRNLQTSGLNSTSLQNTLGTTLGSVTIFGGIVIAILGSLFTVPASLISMLGIFSPYPILNVIAGALLALVVAIGVIVVAMEINGMLTKYRG